MNTNITFMPSIFFHLQCTRKVIQASCNLYIHFGPWYVGDWRLYVRWRLQMPGPGQIPGFLGSLWRESLHWCQGNIQHGSRSKQTDAVEISIVILTQAIWVTCRRPQILAWIPNAPPCDSSLHFWNKPIKNERLRTVTTMMLYLTQSMFWSKRQSWNLCSLCSHNFWKHGCCWRISQTVE